MTDIKKLMEEASPLPWEPIKNQTSASGTMIQPVSSAAADVYDPIAMCDRRADVRLIVAAVNALPAVLEYMSNKHHNHCAVYTLGERCDCGYDALAKALGVEE